MITFKTFLEGDVVDLEKARKRRYTQQAGKAFYDALDQTWKNIEDHKHASMEASMELHDVELDIQRAYNKARVPGFEKFEDLMYFLMIVADVDYHKPHELTPEHRAKVQMVAHHAPRLIQVLSQARVPLHHFLDKWKKVGKEIGVEVAPMEDAAFLDHQLWSDIQSLKKLEQAHKEGKL